MTIILIISWKKDPIILKLDKQFIYVWLSSCNSCEALDIFKLGQYLKTTLDMNLRTPTSSVWCAKPINIAHAQTLIPWFIRTRKNYFFSIQIKIYF